MSSSRRWVLALFIFFFPLSVFAGGFNDVPQDYRYNEAIETLNDLGIMNGYEDGSFKPDSPITRAEAVKALITLIKPEGVIGDTQENLYADSFFLPFRDVFVDSWAAPYVTLAFQGGIIQGFEDGTFRPNQIVRCAEGLKMALEGFSVDTRRVRFVERPLILMNAGDWFARYFGYAYNQNLINRDKFYHPQQWMTRGEFADLLFRLKTIRENGWGEFPESEEADSDEYRITIPRLNITNLKVTPADPFNQKNALGVLNEGLGHYLATPGSGHKMVVFGHSSGYNWDHSPYKYIFTKIDRLQEGDMIYINYREKGYVYQIRQKEVRPATEMAAVMEDYGYEELALYTCWPPNGISKRYVVYAEPVSN